ncbi:dTDP-4-dehydrorhamnose reductase [Lysinibacter sp. HNR]|uniref:dTDP-4-dehydrorhamnose reductase n=1 Tax=Lysinibacter sp. HNR TaxID=3031408 RepID=UPI0024351768|nr:dTDP-4-dehydrorhamnose reductase [Lysinibacter sp. HNR]WGD38057.1 dTDP-4-dehydrorhamnose reductase [Lysinibacter sp. HNR]
MARILITGAHGMLGEDLQRVLIEHDVTAFGRGDLDITNEAAVRSAVNDYDAVINAAAYTAVDNAETDEDAALLINGTGPTNLARATRLSGAKLVQISTDYVFDGSATTPYAENTPHAPISAYGRTKAAGEKGVLTEHPDGSYIVRTAWLYGQNGANFAQTMLNLAAKLDTFTVVDDQFGQPTWTRDLASQIALLIDSDAAPGIYHGTNSGKTSWRGFAQAVLSEAGLDPARVHPTDSASFVRPAPRPSYSVLGHDAWVAAGLPPMRPWREALHAAFEADTFTLTPSKEQ